MPHSNRGESGSALVDESDIRSVEIFNNLDLQACSRISSMIRTRFYSPGQFIISNASQDRDAFFLINGTVRVCAFSAHGRQVQFEDLTPGQVFGEIAALDGGARTSDCIAVTDVVVGSVKHDVFYEILSEFPAVNKAVLLRLTSMLRRQMERVFEISTATVAMRLRYELIRLGSFNEKGDAEIVVINPPTHADIAARISSHREAVTKEMRKLENAGIVTWTRGRCVIHKINSLAEL